MKRKEVRRDYELGTVLERKGRDKNGVLVVDDIRMRAHYVYRKSQISKE